MSHFADIKTQLNDHQALINGLREMGFLIEAISITPEMTAKQIAKAALRYVNSYNDSCRAHIIARHPKLREKHTAIGFLWDSQARAYTLQCDPYEIRHSEYGSEFDYSQLTDEAIQTLLNYRVQLEHDRAGVLLKYPASNFVVTEQRIDNEITFTIKPKPQIQQTISHSIGSAI